MNLAFQFESHGAHASAFFDASVFPICRWRIVLLFLFGNLSSSVADGNCQGDHAPASSQSRHRKMFAQKNAGFVFIIVGKNWEWQIIEPICIGFVSGKPRKPSGLSSYYPFMGNIGVECGTWWTGVPQFFVHVFVWTMAISLWRILAQGLPWQDMTQQALMNSWGNSGDVKEPVHVCDWCCQKLRSPGNFWAELFWDPAQLACPTTSLVEPKLVSHPTVCVRPSLRAHMKLISSIHLSCMSWLPLLPLWGDDAKTIPKEGCAPGFGLLLVVVLPPASLT